MIKHEEAAWLGAAVAALACGRVARAVAFTVWPGRVHLGVKKVRAQGGGKKVVAFGRVPRPFRFEHKEPRRVGWIVQDCAHASVPTANKHVGA